jgi:SAM-dependent methyltransferase
MADGCCGAAAGHFDPAIAEADLEHYRRHGLDRRAKLLLEALRRAGVPGRTVLDIGSGAGALSFELLKAGASRAILADASTAYLSAARAESDRASLSDRLQFVAGDFVDTAHDVPVADIVVLDRAVCCYPAWAPLVAAAMSRGRVLLGLSYPRARLDVRFVIGLENLRRRWKGDAFRAFVHPPAAMEAALHAGGWRLVSRRGTFVWRVDLYQRSATPGVS